MGAFVPGGFVSRDGVEKQKADSESKQADVLSEQAHLARAGLGVDDCILRAPFDGEIAERFADPGSFARPGFAGVPVVDPRTVRVIADVPESDFDAVAPKTPATIHLL